jgi:RES domain-containing protein
MLVQDEPLRASYMVIEARIPDSVIIDRIPASKLPSAWRRIASRHKLQSIGTDWARKSAAVMLAVPSGVIPTETNYLLNPQHPDFRRIKFGKLEPCETLEQRGYHSSDTERSGDCEASAAGPYLSTE